MRQWWVATITKEKRLQLKGDAFKCGAHSLFPSEDWSSKRLSKTTTTTDSERLVQEFIQSLLKSPIKWTIQETKKQKERDKTLKTM